MSSFVTCHLQMCWAKLMSLLVRIWHMSCTAVQTVNSHFRFNLETESFAFVLSPAKDEVSRKAAVTRQLARMHRRCQGCGNLEGSKDTAWHGVSALCWTHQQRAALYLGSSSLCPCVSFLHMWEDKVETPADTSAAVSDRPSHPLQPL